jgi:hypothetical protein
MTADDESTPPLNGLLGKLGFDGVHDLLTKDLREPANGEAQVTPVRRVGIYGGGLR